MAPGYQYYQGTCAVTDIWSPTQSAYSGCYSDIYIPETKKVETKKEKTQRIAKEKMYASWKSHNQNKPEERKVIQIKQICKPRHRISNLGGRRF